MILIIWAAIAIVVLVSVLLIYPEHDWGLALGGATVVILVVSYFSAELVLRSPFPVCCRRDRGRSTTPWR